jgi:hypothetical protein
MASKLATLEESLFDTEDRLRPGLSDELMGALLSEINDLRHHLGWLGLDLGHHHVWPTDTTSQRVTIR